MDTIAARVWTALVTGDARAAGADDDDDAEPEADVPGLGSFQLRTYKPYEGRNPRTGERVHVPGKRLVFFMIDPELRDHLQAGTRPSTPWIASLVEETATGAPFIFGRLGALRVHHKGERVGRDPQTGHTITIPARVVLTFVPSQQIVRALNGAEVPRIADATAIAQALASFPAGPPTSLVELDAAVARLGLDPAATGLVPSAARAPGDDGTTVIARTADGDDRWILDGTSVSELADDGVHSMPLTRWAPDMLLVALIRHAAGDAVLSPADARLVLARLAPGGLFGLGDLPF
jgi:nucleoid DNA-binding protein